MCDFSNTSIRISTIDMSSAQPLRGFQLEGESPLQTRCRCSGPVFLGHA
jgi:hypothetical protein